MNFYTKSLCRASRRRIAKLLLVMKLTLVLLTSAILHVSASTYGQNVSLNQRNTKLSTVFNEIRKQTGYDFIFSDKTIAKAKPVDLNLKNASIEQALIACFKDQPLTYTIENKIVTVELKEKSYLERMVERFNAIDIRGKIVDNDGLPLKGATIKVKGTNQYTTTNNEGSFTLNNVPENALIVVSFIGYQTLEIKVQKNMGIMVLSLADSKLDDVQIIAYGTTTKRLNTGNVSTLKATDIEKQPVNNALLALQGRAPGVLVTQDSGLPNSTVKIQIRGTNSIAQGTDPLYIVDGVPYSANMLKNVGTQGSGEASPFSFINPSSVESIDVLKDADATAIYGSRGANGVILITTKKGKAGATKFDFNLYTGIAKTPVKGDFMNRDQYLEMRNEAFRNTGITKSVNNAPDLLLWDTTRNENWQKRLLGHAAVTTNAQAAMSGGNDNSSYRVFVGYNKTTPPFPGDFKSDKISGGINLSTTSSNKRFNAQVSVSYLSDKTFLPSYNPLTGIMLAPVAPEPFNPDGSINYKDYSTNNPFPGFYTTYTGKTNNLISNASLSYKILDALVFRVTGGYTSTVVNGAYAYSIKAQVGNPFISVPSGQASFSNNNMTSLIAEPQLSYSGAIGKGKWEALVGTTFQTSNSTGELINASGYTNDAQLPSLAAASTIFRAGSVYEKSKFNSVYARINYNLEDKYLINVTGRRDGSSRFGPDSRFGNFGAIGAAWIFTKEKFIEDNLSFLSFGKLRGSYGVTGNEPGSNYAYVSLHSFNSYGRPYQNGQSISADGLLSPDYRWEEVRKLEGGIELGFLKDRILLSTSYFKNRSGNQLVSYDLPDITGFTAVQLNRDATVQNTGLEVSLSTQNINTPAFTWSSNFNITASRNKLVAFPGLATSPYYNRLIIGQPLSVVLRNRAAGVDPETGVYQFYDKNGNLTFTPTLDDRTAMINTEPKFYGGLQNSFSYKNFGLDFFIYFVKQLGFNYDYISPQAPGRSYFGDGNQSVAVLDRWQKKGDQAKFQKFTSSSGPIADAYYQQQNSDAAYTDASYIRLKNVSFSYKLPASFLKKLNVNETRFYFQAQNLFTITNYKGLDPEGQGTTPPLSIWTLGAQITF